MRFTRRPLPPSPSSIRDACTEHQRAVVVLLARYGYSDKQIAAELGITLRAAKGRLRRIYDKLKIRKRYALAVAWIQEERDRGPRQGNGMINLDHFKEHK